VFVRMYVYICVRECVCVPVCVKESDRTQDSRRCPPTYMCKRTNTHVHELMYRAMATNQSHVSWNDTAVVRCYQEPTLQVSFARMRSCVLSHTCTRARARAHTHIPLSPPSSTHKHPHTRALTHTHIHCRHFQNTCSNIATAFSDAHKTAPTARKVTAAG